MVIVNQLLVPFLLNWDMFVLDKQLTNPLVSGHLIDVLFINAELSNDIFECVRAWGCRLIAFGSIDWYVGFLKLSLVFISLHLSKDYLSDREFSAFPFARHVIAVLKGQN